MTDNIITCNAGSNSLKCAVYDADSLSLIYRFGVDRIHDESTLTIRDAEGEKLVDEQSIESGYEEALSNILKWYDDNGNGKIIAAGHRVVHGGKEFDDPVKINKEVRKKIEALIPLAPLHQPYNLKLIDILYERYPSMQQVACFDTSFHRTQPWVAQQFALPRDLVEKEDILRYGFHGLSYEYIVQALPEHIGSLEDKRIVVAHLGSGASMCAIKDGKSIATTMGFTALDGLMMSKRCGDLDPGVILYLMQEKGMSAEDIEKLLYQESGLLGTSGISADMRDLDGKENVQAKQAVDLFCYTAAKHLGGLITVMGGLDYLVFTGAMGCGDFFIRAKICDYLKWMKMSVDEVANANHNIIISAEQSSIPVVVLPTDEEQVIAGHTKKLLT